MWPFKRIGTRVVASTPDTRLPQGCLHAGTIIGTTSNHYMIRFDEPDKHTGQPVEAWVYNWDVARIKSLKESV
jgi:hypothetical protein